MNDPRAREAAISGEDLCVFLEDGRTLLVPLRWFPKLANAPKASREKLIVIGHGSGIRWPDLDEDLSVKRLLLP